MRNGAAFKTDKTIKIRQSIGNKAESDMPLSPGQGFCTVLSVALLCGYSPVGVSVGMDKSHLSKTTPPTEGCRPVLTFALNRWQDACTNYEAHPYSSV